MEVGLKNYPLMSSREIIPYIKEMERLKVSEVARSPRGFLYNYLKYGGMVLKSTTPNSSIDWWKTRENFIKRHLVQYNKNPTYRRKLALIAWAYMPSR